jgi:hypothetical protein
MIWMKDSLPKENVMVLLLIDHKEHGTQRHVGYHASGRWHLQSCCATCKRLPFSVIYWMPLPKEPTDVVRDKKEKEVSE